jgi:hypothetical protein
VKRESVISAEISLNLHSPTRYNPQSMSFPE